MTLRNDSGSPDTPIVFYADNADPEALRKAAARLGVAHPRLVRLDEKGDADREIAINGLRLAVRAGGPDAFLREVTVATPDRVLARDLRAAGCDGVVSLGGDAPFTRILDGRLWHNPGAGGWFGILTPGPEPRTLTIAHASLLAQAGSGLAAAPVRLSWQADGAQSATWPEAARPQPLSSGKFDDPAVTARGEPRARVGLDQLSTLWINTGTLCNLSCASCYIESTPRNDRLAYFTARDARDYFDEIAREGMATREIGFTGGEPFLSPDMIEMMSDALARGFRVLVLTNAMKPMRRYRDALLDLNARFGDRLTMRVSIDHYSKELHELERGPRSWEPTIEGLRWLGANGFRVHVAGRLYSGEPERQVRAGYGRLFAQLGVSIDASDPIELVLFPEMDAGADVPEITEACWGILGKSPSDVMCASSRMVVRRKGAEAPAVLACTLLAYDERFELGRTLSEAARPVALNHPHCARFCVLGGAACSKG